MCSFNKYSLSTYYVSGADLGSMKRQGPCTHDLPGLYCYLLMTLPAPLNSEIHMGQRLVGVCAFSLQSAGIWTRRWTAGHRGQSMPWRHSRSPSWHHHPGPWALHAVYFFSFDQSAELWLLCLVQKRQRWVVGVIVFASVFSHLTACRTWDTILSPGFPIWVMGVLVSWLL